MNKRYLDKETISYRFKWDVLAKDENSSLSLENKKKLWEVFLYRMCIMKLISKHSSKRWIYPEKLVEFKKK